VERCCLDKGVGKYIYRWWDGGEYSSCVDFASRELFMEDMGGGCMGWSFIFHY
jgi:hypothetical protein